jgi:Fe-S-cluster containining protein
VNRKKRRKLHELYARIPKIKCKGLCTDECTTIGMFPAEFAQITRVGGEPPRLDLLTRRCNYLRDGQCAVYDDRPYICRAFGVTPIMPCVHGCEAERIMTPAEDKALMREIGELLGGRGVVFTAL